MNNGYEYEGIFNAYETALFQSLILDKTLTVRGEMCGGGHESKKKKKPSEILLCYIANATENAHNCKVCKTQVQEWVLPTGKHYS
jgi:hypothetical protein